jgi:flagellar hook-associated protein 1 FlgK
VNELTTDIAALNTQIVSAQGGETNVSGLKDARDTDIGSLASLVSVQVLPQADGSTTVSLAGGGEPLVDGSLASTMAATPNADGTQTLTVNFVDSSFTLTGTGLGGQLGGLQSFQDGTLLPMMQTITSMAQQLTSSYNTQLAAGYTPAGTAGGPLFQYTVSGNTGTLSVTPGIQSSDLAFSANAANPGDSGNLTQLIALTNEPVTLPTLGAVSLSDAMTQIVGTLGTQSQENQNAATTAQTVSDQATATWQSVSGVSSDEEAANLIQYQQMYQANMSVIQVANTLFANTLAMFTITT